MDKKRKRQTKNQKTSPCQIGIRTIWSLLRNRIENLKKCVSKWPKSVFNDHEAHEGLSSLHDKYAIVIVDIASSNTYLFVKLITSIALQGNWTLVVTPQVKLILTMTKSRTTISPYVFSQHRNKMWGLTLLVLNSQTSLESIQRINIAGSSFCSTKEMSIHLTKILSTVKDGQQASCNTTYSRNGINRM